MKAIGSKSEVEKVVDRLIDRAIREKSLNLGCPDCGHVGRASPKELCGKFGIICSKCGAVSMMDVALEYASRANRIDG
jgi:predicted RNA-binding Zn-ribbon protein involved in translation (DUF1610 family)